MPAAQIGKKVEDYLHNSQALEDWWQQPISAEQLQAERTWLQTLGSLTSSSSRRIGFLWRDIACGAQGVEAGRLLSDKFLQIALGLGQARMLDCFVAGRANLQKSRLPGDIRFECVERGEAMLSEMPFVQFHPATEQHDLAGIVSVVNSERSAEGVIDAL